VIRKCCSFRRPLLCFLCASSYFLLKHCFRERSNFQLRRFHLQISKYNFLRIKLEPWYFTLWHPVFGEKKNGVLL